MELRPFHLAIPVNDLQKTRDFYGGIMGFTEGRSDEHWIDWNCFGHQLVTHLNENFRVQEAINSVDGHGVPIPHFGVVLTMEDWQTLADRLKAAGIQFVIEPYIRFKGQPGEQATLFFLDPSGNALEFKAFKDLSSLFAK